MQNGQLDNYLQNSNSIIGMIIINNQKPISRVANGMSGINKRI